jgi:hypothetical protein
VLGQATIAMADLSPFNVYSPDYEEMRRDTAYCGLVASSAGRAASSQAVEPSGSAPYGAPASMSQARRATPCSRHRRRTPARPWRLPHRPAPTDRRQSGLIAPDWSWS